MPKMPYHVGLLINNELTACGVGWREAADALDVSRAELYQLLGGAGALTVEMALRLELAGIGTAPAWLALQNTYDLAQLRLRKSNFKVVRLVPEA
jgi:antitoxin HigA-1